MSQEKTLEVSKRAESNWGSLYRIAGLGTITGIILMLVDIGLSFAGGDVQVGGMRAVDWFALYQGSWFLGLRNLGFFNVISTILAIPLYLALYRLHRKAVPAYAALALILFLFGAAIYNGNNRALAMLSLSNQYSTAQTEAEKSVVAAAGTVTLAQAEDFTPGTLLGFLLTSTGSIVMMVVMLLGRVYGKRTALAGLVGSSCLLVFTLSVTFVPASMGPAMILALIGGLLMIGWNIAMALAMFRLGKTSAGQRQSMIAVAQ